MRNSSAVFSLLIAASLALSVSRGELHTLTPPKNSTEQIKTLIDKNYPSLEKLYTDIHANPELSLKEEKTAARLAKEFRDAGFEVTEKIGGTGVVAVLKNGEGKTLLLRTELDALPVKEQTGAPYASTLTALDPNGKEVPVMHACGHDIHMTCIVGAARTLAAMKDKWKGTLVIIGQPAEETLAGAKAMLKDGLFEKFPKPDFCLAQHVDASTPAGKVGITSGYTNANSDSFDITIRGSGGHGSAPHTTKDPIVIAAQTILNLQVITSREVKPGDAVVITVGSIHGGTKSNIIPDEVKLEITVRTQKDETREKVFKAIERIVKGTAVTAGVPDDLMPIVTHRSTFAPAVYNAPDLADRISNLLKTTLGAENVAVHQPSMGGEDFAFFGRTADKIPIFMLRLGSADPEKVAAAKTNKTQLPSLHSSKYLPAKEPTIRTGTLTLTAAALDLLAK
jgi:hippurate hydrolase